MTKKQAVGVLLVTLASPLLVVGFMLHFMAMMVATGWHSLDVLLNWVKK